MLQMSQVSEPGHTRDFDKCSVSEIVGALGQGLRKNEDKSKEVGEKGESEGRDNSFNEFFYKGEQKRDGS